MSKEVHWVALTKGEFDLVKDSLEQTAKLLEKKRDSHRLNDVVDLLGGGFSTFGRSTHAHCSNCGNSKKVKHVSKPCCESPYLWMSAR